MMELRDMSRTRHHNRRRKPRGWTEDVPAIWGYRKFLIEHRAKQRQVMLNGKLEDMPVLRDKVALERVYWT